MNADVPITEVEITSVVKRFYTKVRTDSEIGPIFNAAVQSWDAHEALLIDFWSTVLLATRRYKGNPLLVHFRLPIEERHFDRWLALFSEAVNEVMTSSQASIVLNRANHVATNMKRVLAST